MDQSEAEKWAMGSEFPPEVDPQAGPGFGETPGGAPGSTTMGGAGGAPGWAQQNARFLHVAAPLRHSRFLHDSVTARLTPEDIKKAREAKQAAAKLNRQKVSETDSATYHEQSSDVIWYSHTHVCHKHETYIFVF